VSDLSYVLGLSRKEFEAIGFIPKPRLEQYERDGNLWIQRENGEPCGFLVWGMGQPIMKVYQVCIQYDARRQKNALDLIAKLTETAKARNCEGISLWCAEELEANAFWKACGFRWVMDKQGGKRRGRKLNLWFLPLQTAQGLLIA
jgi:hypothetical protein